MKEETRKRTIEMLQQGYSFEMVIGMLDSDLQQELEEAIVEASRKGFDFGVESEKVVIQENTIKPLLREIEDWKQTSEQAQKIIEDFRNQEHLSVEDTRLLIAENQKLKDWKTARLMYENIGQNCIKRILAADVATDIDDAGDVLLILETIIRTNTAQDEHIKELQAQIESGLCKRLENDDCTCVGCMYETAIKEINNLRHELGVMHAERDIAEEKLDKIRECLKEDRQFYEWWKTLAEIIKHL